MHNGVRTPMQTADRLPVNLHKTLPRNVDLSAAEQTLTQPLHVTAHVKFVNVVMATGRQVIT